jgi:hypothetical protein
MARIFLPFPGGRRVFLSVRRRFTPPRIAIPRYELIKTLRRLLPADWQRTGLHEEHGEVSIEAIVNHIAGHDEEHLAQMARLLGSNRLSSTQVRAVPTNERRR